MTAPKTIVEIDGPLDLKYDGASSVDSDTKHPEERVSIALRDYLQPPDDTSTSLSSTIDKIVEAFPDKPGSGNKYRDLVQVVFDLAEKIPVQHTAHNKLVGTLEAIRVNEKLGKKFGFSADGPSPTVYFDLAFLGRISDVFGRFKGPESYVNFNAFHARIQNSQFRVPGIWAATSIWAAFTPQRDTAQMAVREAYVLGAAQWILWGGQATFQVYSSQQSVKRNPSLRKWSSWKQAFEDFSHGEQVGDECKSICKIVVGMMEELAGGEI